MSKERLTRLSDVDISDIRPAPDRGITKLVRAIRGRGHTTMGSCEGGLEGSHHLHPFPWVTVHGVGFEDDLTHQQITGRLEEFNQRSNVRWITDRTAVRPEEAASNKKELQKLQASAGKLAEFLFGE